MPRGLTRTDSLALAMAAALIWMLPGCSGGPADESHAISRRPQIDLVSATPEQRLAVARRLLRETPLVDGHNDIPWQYRQRVYAKLRDLDLSEDLSDLEPQLHTDIPRLREGGLGAQFWSVYIPATRGGGRPGDARIVMEQIDLTRRMIDRYSDTFEFAGSADDIERIHAEGKIASLMGMEGGHSIEDSMGVLRMTYDAGVRYMTLTHSLNTRWADSATDQAAHGGLTDFGREIVREMNRLGMLIDLSHVSEETMHDALDVADAPVIFSHSSTMAVTDSPRNVPDSVLERLRRNGGVIMITFVPAYVSQDVLDYWQDRQARQRELQDEFGNDVEAIRAGMNQWSEENPAPRATLHDVADHIEHAIRVAGINHVGLGGDYDGVPRLPEGLEDVSGYPNLVAELFARGYTRREVRKIVGENALRVMREAERAAARLQRLRPPSEARIEELDAPAETDADGAS